jgi:hypothetical protein
VILATVKRCSAGDAVNVARGRPSHPSAIVFSYTQKIKDLARNNESNLNFHRDKSPYTQTIISRT